MIQELQARIARYLSEGKHRSLNSLATKAGVSYSTLTRIAQGKSQGVELANVLAILQVVTSRDEGAAFLAEYFPNVQAYLKAMAEASKRPEAWTTAVSTELEAALYDYESFCIISLASTPRGTTEEEIAKAVGQGSLEKLAALISNEVLEVHGGRVFSTQRDFTPTNNAALQAEIGHMLHLVRPCHIGQERQHCAVRTNGVTRQAQRKIHAILQQALLEADAVIAANPGDVPIFVGTVMGMFLPAGDEP